MINLDPALVPTIVFGHEFGRGVYDKNEIEIVGDSIEQFTSKDFDVDRTPVKPFKMSGVLKYLNNFIVAKPVINKNRCIKCGICVNVCPVKPKAVDWVNNDKKQTPAHNYHLCIRCYCCQELCPAKAIDLKKPLVRKLFSRKK
jgi:MinD superfamily P-loop ATPase